MKNIFLLTMLLPIVALAAGGEAHGDGVPGAVKYQFINLSILIAGIIYFTKDAVAQMFSSRNSDYVNAAQKSAQARKAAENNLAEIKDKLNTLNSKKEETITMAKSQAEEIKKQLQSEAAQMSKRIREEAELMVKVELQKAQKELREKLVHDSLEIARGVLAKDISPADHSKLQGDFTKQVEGAV